jgi:DNA-3-methyladenine glycosylase II
MRGIIDRLGPLERKWPKSSPFAALVLAIVHQQLAIRAAQTIHTRLLALMSNGEPTPDALLALTEGELRGAGLSFQKIGYLRDLALKTRDGVLSLSRLGRMSDEEVAGEVTQVRGIGRWSAQILLMSALERPDVLAADDLGLLQAAQKAYGLERRPTPRELEALGEAWRPWRTLACQYLWRSLREP